MSSPATARLAAVSFFGDAANALRSKESAGVSAETDERLISLVQSNERDALTLLFRRYAYLAYAIGRKVLRDRTEAEDLVQEVFLYIHRKSALFDSAKGSARSWILQVAYTQALLRRRRLKSQGFYASSIADKLQGSESPDNSEAKYDLSVEGLFGRTAWPKVLDALTPDQRETLRLHFFEGYTFSEIAERLGQSYVSVRHHYYRGLEKLRRHLIVNELSKR